jgi:aryl-alcohol dehydrogenase-like predicted oxidoreductase
MNEISRRRMGRLNRQVTEIGLGCAELAARQYGRANLEADSFAVVERALQLGINYFDTSAGYGESEERLGKALRGVPRDSYFLATKTGTGTQPRDYSFDGTLRSVEKSLRLLGTDFLDLVQIHDIGPDDFELAFSLNGALGALLQLKAQGTIGGIGIGVRDHEFLRAAIENPHFDTILTYADFNLVRQSARRNLFASAAAHDKAIILGSPLLMGLLTDCPWEELLRTHGSMGTGPDAQRALRIRQWAAARQISVVHLAIQYVLREARISTVLTGAARFYEVEQNLRAATTPLPESIWHELRCDLEIE